MTHARPHPVEPGVSSKAIAECAARLKEGELVIIPTETVYGLAGQVASQAAVARFAAVPRTGGPGGPPWTWHAPSRPAVEAALPLATPVHRRLVHRLLPGPVRFLVELSDSECQTVLAALGAVPGAIDGVPESGEPGRRIIHVRVPDHPAAVQILEMAEVPVVAQRLSSFGLPGPYMPGFADLATAAGVAAWVDDGPPRFGMPSTTVVLDRSGFRVTSEGAVTERAIRRLLHRNVLFVCTGNTCRSPMAEAVARHLLEKDPALAGSGITTRVSSAGISAGAGHPATPEGVEALRGLGISAGHHRSRALTGEMVSQAEVVYVMTSSHRDAVLEVAPEAAEKILVLDPKGLDIPDPIGGPPSLYVSTVRRLYDAVKARLTELDITPRP